MCLIPMFYYCQSITDEKANVFGNEIIISIVNELTGYSIFVFLIITR